MMKTKWFLVGFCFFSSIGCKKRDFHEESTPEAVGLRTQGELCRKLNGLKNEFGADQILHQKIQLKKWEEGEKAFSTNICKTISDHANFFSQPQKSRFCSSELTFNYKGNQAQAQSDLEVANRLLTFATWDKFSTTQQKQNLEIAKVLRFKISRSLFESSQDVAPAVGGDTVFYGPVHSIHKDACAQNSNQRGVEVLPDGWAQVTRDLFQAVSDETYVQTLRQQLYALAVWTKEKAAQDIAPRQPFAQTLANVKRESHEITQTLNDAANVAGIDARIKATLRTLEGTSKLTQAELEVVAVSINDIGELGRKVSRAELDLVKTKLRDIRKGILDVLVQTSFGPGLDHDFRASLRTLESFIQSLEFIYSYGSQSEALASQQKLCIHESLTDEELENSTSPTQLFSRALGNKANVKESVITHRTCLYKLETQNWLDSKKQATRNKFIDYRAYVNLKAEILESGALAPSAFTTCKSKYPSVFNSQNFPAETKDFINQIFSGSRPSNSQSLELRSCLYSLDGQNWMDKLVHSEREKITNLRIQLTDK